MLGKFATPATVYVASVHSVEDDSKPLMANQEAHAPTDAVAANNVLYNFNLLAVKPAQGFYALELRVVPTGTGHNFVPVDGAKLHVKVLGSVTVGAVELSVGDAADSTPRRHSVEHPRTVTPAVDGDSSQTLRLAFKLTYVPVCVRI